MKSAAVLWSWTPWRSTCRFEVEPPATAEPLHGATAGLMTTGVPATVVLTLNVAYSASVYPHTTKSAMAPAASSSRAQPLPPLGQRMVGTPLTPSVQEAVCCAVRLAGRAMV
ncbi:MAG: hypothetical protein U1F77_06840 [Kiritimatiellia bacterium]